MNDRQLELLKVIFMETMQIYFTEDMAKTIAETFKKAVTDNLELFDQMKEEGENETAGTDHIQ